MARLRSGRKGHPGVRSSCGRPHDDARPCGQGRASRTRRGQAAEPSATLAGALDAPVLLLPDVLDDDEEPDEAPDEPVPDELDSDEPEPEVDEDSLGLDEEESPEPFAPASLLPAGIDADEPLRESVR